MSADTAIGLPVRPCTVPKGLQYRSHRVGTGRNDLPGWADGIVPSLGCLYVVVLYLEPLIRYFLSRVYAEAFAAAALCAAFVVATISAGEMPCSHPNSRLRIWGLFLYCVLLSALINDMPMKYLALSAYRIGTACAAYYVFRYIGSNRRGLHRIAVVVVLLATMNSAVALWGAVTHRSLFGAAVDTVGPAAFGYDASSGRSGGLIGDNYVGIYDLPCVAGAMGLLRRRRFPLIALLVIIIGCCGILASGSRGSLATLAVGCLILACLANPRRPEVCSILFVCVTLGITVAAFGAMTYYIRTLPGNLEDTMRSRFSIQGIFHDSRVDLYSHYINEIAARPIMGYGPGHILVETGYDISRDNTGQGFAMPHNSELDIAVSFGIPALLVYMALLLGPLAHLSTIRRVTFGIWLYAWYAGVLVSTMTLSIPFEPVIWCIAGMLHGRCSSALPVPLIRTSSSRAHAGPDAACTIWGG